MPKSKRKYGPLASKLALLSRLERARAVETLERVYKTGAGKPLAEWAARRKRAKTRASKRRRS